MSSPIFEAMVSSITSTMDPERKKASEYLDTVIAERQADLADRKAQSIERLEKQLIAAKERNASVTVIEAYDRMLVQVSNL